MENVVIFYDHLKYFTAIRYNLWPLGIVFGRLVYFLRFGKFGTRKIWQPWSARLPFALKRFIRFFAFPEETVQVVNSRQNQGCQMVVYFQTKNPILGTFWSVLQ
jgi:hypothetical protein